MSLIVCVYVLLWGSWQNLQGRVINQLYSSACNTFHCKKPQMPLPLGNLCLSCWRFFSTENPARQTSKTAGFHTSWAWVPQRAGALHFTHDSLQEHSLPSPSLSIPFGLLARRPVSEKCTFDSPCSILQFSPTVSLGSRVLVRDASSLQLIHYCLWMRFSCFLHFPSVTMESHYL